MRRGWVIALVSCPGGTETSRQAVRGVRYPCLDGFSSFEESQFLLTSGLRAPAGFAFMVIRRARAQSHVAKRFAASLDGFFGGIPSAVIAAIRSHCWSAAPDDVPSALT